jgi:hypothetical protein
MMTIKAFCDICKKPISKDNFKDAKRLSCTNNLRITLINVAIMSNEAPPEHKQAICKQCIIDGITNSYVL